MKKQLLVFLPTLFLLTGCGLDNSSGLSSSTTSTSTSTSSSTPVEPAKIDVTIKVTASGIEEWSGSHSKLYINSNFEVSEWNTYVMSQDADNKNVWTYTFSQIEVESRYKFNIYYGSDDSADWSNGLNKEGTSENPLTVTITEDKKVYEFASTFEVPTVSHTFSLILTPHIQSVEGTDDIMYSSTYLWMWCSPNDTVVLTKESNGTWTYQVTDYVGSIFQYTPLLGTQSAGDWSYQHGAYENGTWVQWNSINLTLEEGKSSYTRDIYFKSQPNEITGTTYSITWHYNGTNWETLDGNQLQVCYTVNGGALQWKHMTWDQQTSYNYTFTGSDIPSGALVKYHLYTWKDESARYLAADTSGNDFEVTVNSDLEFIITGDFGEANSYSVATVTPVQQ